jgi:hypothetical protein
MKYILIVECIFNKQGQWMLSQLASGRESLNESTSKLPFKKFRIVLMEKFLQQGGLNRTPMKSMTWCPEPDSNRHGLFRVLGILSHILH